MRNLTYFSLLLLLPILFGSCATKQVNQLKQHRDLLAKMANSTTISPEDKLDAMMTSFTGMMSEGLRIANPKKGGEYVAKYGKENKASIEKILEDVGNWQKGLGPLQQAGLAIRMVQKPYAKDAIDLLPKFKRKYQQIKLIGTLTKGIQSKLFNFGLDKLMK